MVSITCLRFFNKILSQNCIDIYKQICIIIYFNVFAHSYNKIVC